MIQSGVPRLAGNLIGTGVIDEVVQGDLVAAAARKARALADSGSLPRARDVPLDSTVTLALMEVERDKLTARQKLQPAYGGLLDALAATALPFDDGPRRERKIFMSLVPTGAAQALRYQFKAERQASKLPASVIAEPQTVRIVAVIGTVTIGSGIAICALGAGLNVRCWSSQSRAREKRLGRCRRLPSSLSRRHVGHWRRAPQRAA